MKERICDETGKIYRLREWQIYMCKTRWTRRRVNSEQNEAGRMEEEDDSSVKVMHAEKAVGDL